MKALRILLVLQELPLPFGHASARGYWVLMRGLIERGHRVTTYVTCANPADIPRARELFPPPDYDLRCYPFSENKGLWSKLQTLRRPFSYTIHPELRRDLQ